MARLCACKLSASHVTVRETQNQYGGAMERASRSLLLLPPSRLSRLDGVGRPAKDLTSEIPRHDSRSFRRDETWLTDSITPPRSLPGMCCLPGAKTEPALPSSLPMSLIEPMNPA